MDKRSRRKTVFQLFPSSLSSGPHRNRTRLFMIPREQHRPAPHTSCYTPRKPDSVKVAILLGILECYYRTTYLPSLASSPPTRSPSTPPFSLKNLLEEVNGRGTQRFSSTLYNQINAHFLSEYEYGTQSRPRPQSPPPIHTVGVSKHQLKILAGPYSGPSTMIPCRRTMVRSGYRHASFERALIELQKKGLIEKLKRGRSTQVLQLGAGAGSSSSDSLSIVAVCWKGKRERVFLAQPVVVAQIIRDKVFLGFRSSLSTVHQHQGGGKKRSKNRMKLNKKELRFRQYWEEFDLPTRYCEVFGRDGDDGIGSSCGSVMTGMKRRRPCEPLGSGIDDCAPPLKRLRLRRTHSSGFSVPTLPNLLPPAVTALMRVENRSDIQQMQKLRLRRGVVRLQTEPETHRCEVTRPSQIRVALGVFENSSESQKFRKCLDLYESEFEKLRADALLNKIVNRDPTVLILEFLEGQRSGSFPLLVSRPALVDRIRSANPLVSDALIDRTLKVMRRQGLLAKAEEGVERRESWCISLLGEDVLRRRKLAPVRSVVALGSFRTNDLGGDGSVVWLVDSREFDLDKFATRENVFRDHLLDSFERRGLLYQTRMLPLGDYFPMIRQGGIEQAVPLFIERKSVIDLIESFLDGRLQKQMRKLDRLRAYIPKARVFLLVEGDFEEYVTDLAAKRKMRPAQLKQLYARILQEHESSNVHRVVRVQNENSLATLLYQWGEEINHRTDVVFVPMAELIEIMRRVKVEERSGLLIEELRSSQRSDLRSVEASQPHSQPPSPALRRREPSPDLVSVEGIRAKKKKKKKKSQVKVSRRNKKRATSRRTQPKRIRKKLPTLDQYLRKKRQSDSDSPDDSILHEDLLAAPRPKVILSAAAPTQPPRPRRRRRKRSSPSDISLMRYSSSPASSSSDVEIVSSSSSSSDDDVEFLGRESCGTIIIDD